MTSRSVWLLPLLAGTLMLPGCGGSSTTGTSSSSDRSATDARNTHTESANTPFNAESFFASNIAPRLQFCITCHVSGGLADTDEGRGLLLSTNAAQNYHHFYSAWENLGRDVASNAILVENAVMSEPHSGGKTWPVGSNAYRDVAQLFTCWNDPASCEENEEAPPPPPDVSDLPLLEMGPVKPAIVAGCEDQPDDAPVPLDPRSLVVEGVNKPGAAVQFNAYWIDVHNPLPPFQPHYLQKAKTCGEWRERVAHGQHFLESTSYFLSGNRVLTPRVYRNLWKSWGLKERPANFDDEVLKRYGLVKANFRNPYPLEGEDPNLTDGGSGQLPMGFTLVKNMEGRYTGEFTVGCSFCHDSRLGTDDEGQEFHWGRGSNTFDIGVFVNDVSKRIIGIPAIVPFPFGSNAGASNALGVIDFLFVGFDAQTLSINPGVELFLGHGSAGQVKTPNWWSRAWMTRLFHGALSSDNVRSTMALEVASLSLTGAQRRGLEPEFEAVDAFMNSLTTPPYPYPDMIDVPLAEAGAILFHTKDLWANDANADIPRPDGNGSCASCHGVYSPRFAADPAMLPDPRLKGIAGVTTPIEIIRTDPARTMVVSEPMKVAWNTSWWSYVELHPEWDGNDGNTFQRLQHDLAGGGQLPEGPNRWSDIIGYNAPSLYGAWAAAPYFHNGSVPTIWHVLKPSERPGIWQPPQIEPVAPGLNSAMDNSLAAYDFDRLGWQFEEIPCQPGTERFSCNPMNFLDRVLSLISKNWGDKTWLAYQVLPPLSQADVAKRRIMNTHEYSRGNEGHDFTEMLTDQERYALIEYMKTL